MHVCAILLLVFFIGSGAAVVADDQSEIDTRILNNRLNNLESQAVQRRGREPRLIDLLNRQDGRLARQELNTLKTKRPRDVNVPVLERKLRHSRRPDGRFNPR